MSDNATRRRMMVDNQIRPSDVTKFPIIEAFLSLKREYFVPTENRDTAYVGEHIQIGNDRVILDPRTLAKMLDAVDVTDSELVLDVGAGYGYSSAIIAYLAEAVVALESDDKPASEMQNALIEHGIDNVIVEQGPLLDGAASHAPYDVIFVQGGVEFIPEKIISQLKEGGRMVALFMEGTLGSVKIGYKVTGGVNWRFAFNAGAPVLSDFEKEPTFTL
jgi:protein-L-isoaspartate(D-aspartate) O-methyltransferase